MFQEGEQYAKENGLVFLETSAKTAQNVNELFYEIGNQKAQLFIWMKDYFFVSWILLPLKGLSVIFISGANWWSHLHRLPYNSI